MSNNNNKWTLWVALILLVIVFLIIWHFAPVIQRWLADVFLQIIIVLLTFVAGWLIGRFGGKKRPAEERNAKNITEAQKK